MPVPFRWRDGSGVDVDFGIRQPSAQSIPDAGAFTGTPLRQTAHGAPFLRAGGNRIAVVSGHDDGRIHPEIGAANALLMGHRRRLRPLEQVRTAEARHARSGRKRLFKQPAVQRRVGGQADETPCVNPPPF